MKKSFIEKIRPVAQEGYIKYGILPSLTLAQAALESGWGKKQVGNNIFGIKKGSSWTGPTKSLLTHEYVNGRKIRIYDEFRAYPSIEDSVRDYHKLLARAKRYERVRRAKDYKEACIEIQRSGYATDPNYGKKLRQIIEFNKLYQYDKITKNKVKKQVSPWAHYAWKWAIKMGITDGTNPKNYASREEVITFLYRLLDKNKK